jgi:Holliday junction resolvase RusA-like endonuclease
MSRDLVLSFAVGGEPRPQGSKKAFVVKGRAVMIDDNKPALKTWRDAVANSARAALSVAEIFEPAEGALAVAIEFVLARPKTVTRDLPSVQPDIDKLQRAVLDALTTASVWKDDGQVTTISARKIYGPTPGARVSVYREKE